MADRGRHVGLGLLFGVVVPAHLDMGTAGVFTAGVGLPAYVLGLRHAFDADHIAAIDHTTRKLMADGERPMSVGFFFSLGHSTVVFVLALLFSIGVRALVGPVEDDESALQQITGGRRRPAVVRRPVPADPCSPPACRSSTRSTGRS